jgi:hypothetical protein
VIGCHKCNPFFEDDAYEYRRELRREWADRHDDDELDREQREQNERKIQI